MGCGRVCLSIVFLLLVIGIASPFTFLFASGGAYRTPITITEQSGHDLTDYQVKIVLDNTWDGWDHVSSDGSDIYFMDSSNNPLYYWIEEFDYTNKHAIIWVKVPNIQASGSTTIYMYYGGDNPYSSYNDPENVFNFFDDFEDGDLSEYNQYGNDGTPVVEVTSNAVEGSYSLHLAQNTNNAEHVGVAYKYETFTNVRVHVKAVIDSRVDAGIFGILARFQGNDDSSSGIIDQSYYFTIGLRDDKAEISRNDINSGTTLATCSYNVEPGKVYELEAILYNNYLTLYVDGSKVLETNDNTYTSGYFGLVVIEADARFDTFYISKYVDPEPTVSIGSSESVQQGDYPWFSASVSPTSVSVEPSDTVSFDVNVTNTGGSGGWVVVSLVDHNNVTRDSANITLDPDAWQVVTLSTTVTADDRGDWDWLILGYNDTTTFFNISVSVSIHYSLEYSYSYVLDPSASINSSSVDAERFSYIINPSASINTQGVSGNDYNKIWGSMYGLTIYINDTKVYEENGGTIGVLHIYFYYSLIDAPYIDYPDASISIVDADTGETVFTHYIPLGNVSATMYSGKYYKLIIPESGATVHGYGFELISYRVDGVENPATILLTRESTIEIYYGITTAPQDPGSELVIDTQVTSNAVTLFTYSDILLYGGDEFYLLNKTVNGLLVEIPRDSVASNVLDLGTSFTNCLVQTSMQFNNGGAVSGVKGFGVALNGYYDKGIGVFVNDTHVFVSEISYDSATNTWRFGDTLWVQNQSFTQQAEQGVIWYKIGVVNNMLVIGLNIYSDGASINQWFLVNIDLEHPVYVSHITVLDQYGGYSLNSNVLIMRGDYLRFVSAITPYYIIINGVDARGEEVNFALADNDPYDDDATEKIIQWSMIPFVFPIEANLSLKIPGGYVKPNIHGDIYRYFIDLHGLYNDTQINASGLAGLTLPLFSDFSDYRDIVALLIVAFTVLLGSRGNAPVFLSIGVGLLMLFAYMGWLHVSSVVVGAAILVTGMAWAVLHKE